MELNDLFSRCADACAHPAKEMQAAKAAGKCLIGCPPLYIPEELIYACGALPVGLWGADIGISRAKEYFPAFFCGVLQTILELGLAHALDCLDGIVFTQLCDQLKCFSQNFTAALPHIRPFYLQQPQVREPAYAADFLEKRYEQFADELAGLTGRRMTQESLEEAISLYNENRRLLREFSRLAASHPKTVSPFIRSRTIKSGYFLDCAEHNRILRGINGALSLLPEEKGGIRVVTAGIIADAPELLQMLGEYSVCIAADDVAHESRRVRTDVEEKTLRGVAGRYLSMKGCSLLYGGVEQRAELLLRLVRETGADAVLYLLTKFCDPEEYDLPVLSEMLEEEGIPVIAIEVDKSVRNHAQARTILQAFAENF